MGWLLILLVLLAAAPAHSDELGAGPAPGTAATRSELGGCVYQTVAPTSGQQMGFSCDNAGNLKTTASATIGGTVTVTPVSASTWPVHLDGIAANITSLPVIGTDAANANTGKFLTIQGGSATPVLVQSSGTTNVQGVANGVAQTVIGTDALGANTGKALTVQIAPGGATTVVSAVSTMPISGTVSIGNMPAVTGGDSAHANASKFLSIQGGTYVDPVGAVAQNSSISSATTNNVLAKGSAGSFWGAYAVNSTSTSGFLVIINQASIPADGTISAGSVLDCVPLPGNGYARIGYRPGPPKAYSTGIGAVLTSASTCFTTTTGTITGFISVDVQ